MPITYTIYTATGGQTNFTVPFPFIDSSHIKVDINGANTTAFTYDAGNTRVVLTSGATADDKVKVWRETPGRTDSAKILLVDFQDGSVLSESDLDKVTQQLLYLSQEAEETGASSLPIDWDGNYNAGEKRIKSIQALPEADQDVVSKTYVDGLTLHGAGASIPQSWAKVGSNFTGTTGDCTIVLTSPTPVSDTEELFVVSLNGLTQRPTTDFTVTESTGTYTLTLKMGSETLAATDIINIMNFGVARSVLEQPVQPASTSSIGLTVKGLSGQSANILDVQNSSGTSLFGVDPAGILKLAGLNTIPILQIVELTTPGSDSTDPVDSSTYAQKIVTGNKFVITPKRSDSKLLFLARYGWRSYSNMDVSHEDENHNIFWHGGDVHHHINNTASPGSESNGTTIGIKARSYDGYWRNNQSTIYGEMTSIFTHDSPGTSEFVVDVCTMSRVNATFEGSTVPHTFSIYTNDYSTGICVEYYIPS